MLDLWLTGDHFVGKLSAMGQPTRPTQPSIPSGLVNIINAITQTIGLETIKRQTRAAYGCLIAGQIPWARALTTQPIGCTLSLSVTQKAPLQLQYAACGDL